MKNIILIAPPAAGKGTQAQLISEYYNIPHISTGDLLRDEVNSGSVYGKMIKYNMDNGELIDNNLIINILRNRLNRIDCNNGYILDGFPINIEQATIYESMIHDLRKEIGNVVFLEINKELALKRSLSRLICSSCYTSYNTEVPELKPKNPGFCDKCGHPLRSRGEDNEEAFEKIFENHLNTITPLLDYYNNKGLLKTVKIEENDNVDTIFSKIKNIIDEAEENNK